MKKPGKNPGFFYYDIFIPRPFTAELEAVLNNPPPRHSRENGNPVGRVLGVIESIRSLCLPFWIPHQVRNNKFKQFKHIRYPVTCGGVVHCRSFF